MAKILILLPDLRGGGVERIRIVLAREFVKKGHQVEFVLMQAKGELLAEAKAEFATVDLSVSRVRALPLVLANYLRVSRADGVLAAMWPLTVIAPVAARLSGHLCKVIVSEHGMLSAQYSEWGYLHRVLLKTSTAVGYRLSQHRVGVSSGLVRDMAGLSGMRIEDFNVIHNPVPPRPTPTAEAIQKAEALWGTPPGERIVTVGTMKTVKNHPLLLRAFARLNRPNARLMFVGDGAGRTALLALAQELGVAGQVILAGFQADPTPFYQTADLFALSSDYEGFGNVIVEAMACGTPVVSTDCPSGPGEILAGGKYGRLVQVRDVAAMASAIALSLNEPTSKESLKARAADFNPAKAAGAYLNLLEL